MEGKIFNENCLDTMERMDGDTVDVVFTSPPYNRKRNDKYDHYSDTIEDYFSFLCTFTDESIRVCKGTVFINIMKNYYNKEDVLRYIGHYASQIKEIFIWEKSNPLPASGNSITNSYEFIFAFGEFKSNKTYTKNHITTSVASMDKEHKAMMNIKVAKFFIKNFTQPGDLVYDPFMGMGTTAQVCQELGRNWVGSEIIKNYCDQATDKINSVIKQTVLF